MDLTIERHALGKKIFPAVGDTAPPMGMIGTFDRVGSDAGQTVRSFRYWSSYGRGIVDHFIRCPEREFIRAQGTAKLGIRSNEERLNRALIVETVLGLQSGQSPRALEEVLSS